MEVSRATPNFGLEDLVIAKVKRALCLFVCLFFPANLIKEVNCIL